MGCLFWMEDRENELSVQKLAADKTIQRLSVTLLQRIRAQSTPLLGSPLTIFSLSRPREGLLLFCCHGTHGEALIGEWKRRSAVTRGNCHTLSIRASKKKKR